MGRMRGSPVNTRRTHHQRESSSQTSRRHPPAGAFAAARCPRLGRCRTGGGAQRGEQERSDARGRARGCPVAGVGDVKPPAHPATGGTDAHRTSTARLSVPTAAVSKRGKGTLKRLVERTAGLPRRISQIPPPPGPPDDLRRPSLVPAGWRDSPPVIKSRQKHARPRAPTVGCRDISDW